MKSKTKFHYTKLLLVLIFLTAMASCFGKNVDTSAILLNAKMNIIPFNDTHVDDNLLFKIINSKCNYQFIKSKGFDSIAFFTIEINHDSIDELISIVSSLNLPNYKYYYGINLVNNQLLLLKGFFRNDFNILHSFTRAQLGDDERLNNRTYFCKNFDIQGLDLACLYDYYIESKKQPNIKKKIQMYISGDAQFACSCLPAER